VNEWDCITNSEDMILTVTNNGPAGGGAAPANDACTAAAVLPVNAGCVPQNFTTEGATLSLDAPACSGGDANDDVWFSFTATSTDANVNVQGSAEFDAVLQVFSGSCGAFTEIACADVSFNGGAEAAVLTGLTVGQVYYVRVYHWYTAAPTTATFDICVRSAGAVGVAPPNDNCGGAVSLTPSVACNPTAGTVEGATASAPVIACAGTGDGDVWYSFAPNGTDATITVAPNGDMDAVVQVVSGACATPTELDCVDLTVDGEDEVVVLTGLTPGEVYYVRVYDYYGAGSPPTDPTFGICVTEGAPTPPVNDDCDMFTVLPQEPAGTCTATAGTVTGATASTPAGCSGTADDDVWYQFVATDTTAEIRVAGGGTFDPVVEFMAADCSTSLLCVDDEVDATETITLTGLVVGQAYRFRVYHWFATAPSDGNFTVCVTTPGVPPPTTPCSSLTPICTDAGVSYQANANGSIEPGYAADCGDAPVPGNNYGCLCTQPDPTWFYLEVDAAGDIIFTVAAAQDIDYALWGPFANLAAAQGACGSLGAPMDCSFSTAATETVTLTGGTTGQVYILLVTNYANIVQNVTVNQTGGTGSTNWWHRLDQLFYRSTLRCRCRRLVAFPNPITASLYAFILH